jgi:hypothetical protein
MKQREQRILMQIQMPGETGWSTEQVFTGERLYCYLQVEVTEAIDLAVGQVAELQQLTLQEIAGIIAHGLLETAMRQIMAAKMPCSLSDFLNAAAQVYQSCHGLDGHGDAHHQQ